MTAESGAGVDAPEGWGTDDPPVDAGLLTSGSSILDPSGVVVSSWAVTPRDRGSDTWCRVSPGACSETAPVGGCCQDIPSWSHMSAVDALASEDI